MTPEEILLDLRDIHMPERTNEAVSYGIVLWPASLVILIALLALLLSWRRRTTWRREIVQHLDLIERRADEGELLQSWAELAVLLRRIAIRLCDRQEIAGLIGEAWLEKLDHLFQTDIFVEGPGRGITVFPYGDTLKQSHEDFESIAEQLEATIDGIRKRLPQLRAIQ